MIKAKHVIYKLSYYYWLLNCKIAIMIEKEHGLSRIIATLPKRHIVPILKYYGAKIGKNCDIDLGLMLHRVKLPLSNLILKDNTHLGHRNYIDLTEEVCIEKNSAIGSYTMMITHAGDWTFDRSDEQEFRDKIHIGKSVIIYSGSIIAAGVIIGDYARVAANSTVLSNVPKFAFVAGSPAVKKKGRKNLISETNEA